MSAFRIENIEYGWFTASIGKLTLTSSNVTDCDTARELLEGAAAVFLDGAAEALAAWRGEPAARLMGLRMKGMTAEVELWQSQEDAFELGESQEEMRQARGESLGRDSIEAVELLDGLVCAFALYENGNGRALYEAHWGDFPERPYRRLKAFALEVSRRREAQDEDAGLFCGSFLK